ncbi:MULTISPECIES: OprD family porin [Pseudomonas]|uniref:OprD family porin n=1 Tax=Pseudomonas carnis TaxID=2487355 RepID=A0ABT5R9N6_9PSED|nr:OprD family porin [Pseudomonas carnis]MDD1942695.1 OprD family porin [Pseudomonas carnis]CAH0240123.1 Porin D [Pseudomonas carnis]CAH0285734.1 Porin D [Pseudomonas carnis]CAH0308833.1 Porin D [Pseudomonas carnis]CAH0315382.1 Porin D [Pseudomonas carnis]
MGTFKLTELAACVAGSVAVLGVPAVMADQADSKGFIEDSSLKITSRTLYFDRDWHNSGSANNYSRDTGEGLTARFASGFTQGTVGFGIDSFALAGIKFDGGDGNNASASYPKDSEGHTEDNFSKAGVALKMRVSNTVLKAGDQFVALPVFATDTGRLLPESASGFLLTSKEISGLELNLGHFTELSSQYASGSDSKRLKSADVIGGSYAFTKDLSAALYYSDIEDNFTKKYANVNFVQALSDNQSLSYDFNIYHTDSQGKELSGFVDNTIWSFATVYAVGAHSFQVAYQRNSGDTGYVYGADGSAVYNFANSIQYSDFNAKNEASWQARYDLDFAAYGVPGLSFMIRYVRGDNIETAETKDGREWERNESLKYVFQSGAAKNLGIQIRHATNRSSALDSNLDETRLIVDYPINVF